MSLLLDIIIPVYNADDFLDKCLKSVVRSDDFSAYRVIVIDDGSTDNSLKIIESYASKYSNIQFVTRENKGLVRTLNEALSLCRAKYIARMDADDIVLPDRFSKQVSYLDEHVDVAIVGSGFNIIDESDVILSTSQPPVGVKKIRAYTLFGSPICHPSVMVRGDIVYNGHYIYEDEYLCEDYCLWLRILSKFEVNNIDSILMSYRINKRSVSRQNENRQLKNTIKHRDLTKILDVKSKCLYNINNLFSPRTSGVSFSCYFISVLKSIPIIIKSELSLFWFLAYSISGLMVKLGVRK